MVTLQNGIQIVLQSPFLGARNLFLCEGFSGLPLINPCFIAILPIPENSGPARYAAIQLGEYLQREILGIHSSARQVNVPCSGRIRNIVACHAHSVAQCQKLLVLVFDPVNQAALPREATQWLSAGPTYKILPVFPQGAPVNTLIPPQLANLNAAFWEQNISEVIPDIFSLLDITSEDYRLFISYRREDSDPLAQQLFDEFSHQKFDVFLDRFRVPVGLDFQRRLTQELADKAMVLVLESTNILASEWVLYEIQIAKQYRLGRMALNLPGGPLVPEIDDQARLALNSSDLYSRSAKTGTLKPGALMKVVEMVKKEHGRAILDRRQRIRDNIRDALLDAG